MTLSTRVRNLLETEGFNFDELDSPSSDTSEQRVFRLPVKGQAGEWVSLVRVFDDSERILVYSILSENASPEQRLRMAELLTHINYNLMLGNFEMDMEDGEIRYKTSQDCEALDLNTTILRNLIFSNFFSVDRYWNALDQGLHTRRPIAQIMDEAEQTETPSVWAVEDDHVH